jgi:hypothetical protein
MTLTPLRQIHGGIPEEKNVEKKLHTMTSRKKSSL